MVFYTAGDGARIFFEILYVIGIIFQAKTLIANWIRSWRDEESKREVNTENLVNLA